jgi:uncharacterized protein (DUF2236 family)
MIDKKDVTPAADYGFFGPHSVSWKVFSYPTALSVGFQRTVVTEMYEPFLLASVNDTQAVMTRPASRYDRTLQYMSAITFGDSRTAVRASDILVKVHSKVVGTEPISGLRYDANDPHAQLWIHLTAWHSVLYTYEKFGPGRLDADEEARYWSECATAAAFQTIDVDEVPRSRAQVRAYFARMRPVLAATEATQRHVAALLDGGSVLLPATTPRPLSALVAALSRKATIATLPHWMRKMGGVEQSAFTDAWVTAVTRALMRAAARSVTAQRLMVHHASPHSAPVLDPVLCGVPPLSLRTWSPEEARRHYKVTAPAQLYAALTAARAAEPPPAHAPRDGSAPLLAFGP